MNKICFLLALLWSLGTALSAQNQAFDSFIDQHRNDQGFTYALLSKDVFEVATGVAVEDTDWKKLHRVIGQIGSLSILAADSITNGRALYKEARALVPTDVLEDVLAVRDGQTDVRIWAREENAVVSDLVMLVGTPDEFALICFSGAIDLSNLSELAQLLDAETAQDLARASAAVAPSFRLSPNPSAGPLTLSCDEPGDQPRRLSVSDQNGRLLLTRDLDATPTQTIDLSALANGSYWVQLETAKGKVGVKQILIAR